VSSKTKPKPNPMDAAFGTAMATRGRGAAPGQNPAPPATFTEPGAEKETAGKTEGTADGSTSTGKEVTPIGGKVFDGKSNAASGEAIGEGALSQADHTLLTQCESRIRAFGKAAADAGEAFETIKERKLHRHYRLTWSEYTLQHWGLSASQADRLIAAAPVMRELGITHEGTARELVKARRAWGPEAARAIWDGSRDGADGKATARIVRVAVKAVKEEVDKGSALGSPKQLQTMARKAAAQADAMKTAEPPKRKAPRPAQKTDDEIVDAEIIDEDAPAWAMPEEAVREWSRLFAERAKATGDNPETVMHAAYKALRDHYARTTTEAPSA
jgi:hypothetical protein